MAGVSSTEPQATGVGVGSTEPQATGTGVGSTEPQATVTGSTEPQAANPPREEMSWDDLGAGARDLAQMVADDAWRPAVPMILPPVPDLVDFGDFKVLIADDVADTGATLELVKDFCSGKVADVRCAVLYEKPRSTVQCEYVWRRTDRWITFPWSAEEPVLQALPEPA